MKYFAHSLEKDPSCEKWHTLRDHLMETGKLAGRFGNEFGAEKVTRLAGLLHDLGKYSEKFQGRLAGSKNLVDHSTAGAVEVKRIVPPPETPFAELVSYAIAGHHAGLSDFCDLRERLGGKTIEPLDEIWRQELQNVPARGLGIDGFLPSENRKFQLAFLGRMIFSCLVDADYKDTESFYAAAENRNIDRDWPHLRDEIDGLLGKFDAFMETVRGDARDTDFNRLRREILEHVCNKAVEPKGVFTLTVPTGGGKTLASLGFALKHAKKYNLRRIIYAIPFTSIIEQNAAIFKNVLGEDCVLEHHAAIEIEKKEEQKKEQKSKLQLAMEDWAAPVVVTTNVQLFESLFANRSSRCRKLHNLANSVIILDEAQTLPLHLLRPCLAALDELVRNYGASVILCTATQPALNKKDFGAGGFDLEGRELAPDPDLLAKKLRRVTIKKEPALLSDESLIRDLTTHSQSLVIVNSRRHALCLYEAAQRQGLGDLVHLTTRQYAVHRHEILTDVRNRLKDGRPCRVIATSLIEAGVDIDFPRVWRAETGLDQIAQAAGRCNREGLNKLNDSIVTVFKSSEHKPPREIAQFAEAFSRISGNFDDILSPDAIREYFRELYWQKGAGQLDRKKILDEFKVSGRDLMFNYRTAAENFRMIENAQRLVIIDTCDTVRDILGQLNNQNVSAGKCSRILQPYIVQIPHTNFDELIRSGQVTYYRSDLWGEQFSVLTDRTLYTKEKGLIWESAGVLEETIF